MVVLDATIVNVALPHIQDALHFSGTNLEWVVNAYALAFGGLLLLGGRSGDLLGRRRIFIAGILLFALASLAGGFATDQAWLLGARIVQGIGGALAAPTSLALIAVTFPEGRERNRAMGVYAAMSIAGGAVGLIAGGLLTSYADWRWVFFVNVPIGLVVAFLAPRVLGESERQKGRFDLPGAITASLGLGALVYGLSSAATSFTNGRAISHWGDTKVIVSLVASVVLLGAFALIEARSKHALVPPRVLRSRNRTGAYLISLCIGTALFGMFFFMTLFVQQVWGYSPVKSGISYLPMVGGIFLGAGLSSNLVGRLGARPLMIIGPAFAAGGMYWLSRITEASSYAGGLLGPMILTGLGMGLTFVPLSLVALAKVPNADSGVASSLLNTGQQVGGSIGLAILGTVAWSAVASNLRSASAAAGSTHLSQSAQTAMSNHALAYGFSQGYLVSAGIALLALIVSLIFIRIKKADLEGVDPMAAPTD
ncbi:DHA2 family efflux MFS transporter permease subunit [Trebonia kvetii]|uniref:DHA2 family efflux MFS transporter permease subunit n=2 Tax=Trebonia kvetii TaxID=2480626 RepID=A0A6P2BS24_9ACTN|nr:DHA2 family efflux MFS transporter permease subunit [Trebonia kvetii]